MKIRIKREVKTVRLMIIETTLKRGFKKADIMRKRPDKKIRSRKTGEY